MAEVSTLSLRIDTSGMKEAQRDLEKLGNTGGMVEGAIKKLAAAFAAYQVAGFIKDTALLTARYDTLGVSMNTVGKNAGYTSAAMAFYQKQLQETGISALESRDTLTQMAAAQINLADSSKLARIAQDAAVIGNINSSEAFNRMIQGIRSGQVEILRTIGINVTFEQGYQKLAKSLGKATADLSEHEKMQSRTNQVMEYGKNIAGTYEAAMGTAGKQLKSMERYAQDLQLQLGQVFQPSLNVLVEDLTRSLKGSSEWMDKNQEATGELGKAMAEVVRQGDEFLNVIGKMAGGGEGAAKGVGALTRATQYLSLGMADVTDGLAGVWGTVNVSLASALKLSDEAAKKVVGGGGLNWGSGADAWKSYGMGFLNPLSNGGSALDQWNQRTFGTEPSHYAGGTNNPGAWTSDPEGGSGMDPYGVDALRKSTEAREAAIKAAEAYAKVLTPMNQAMAAEHVLLRDGERAAFAYKLQMMGLRDADAAALLVKWDGNKALREWKKIWEDVDKAEQNWLKTQLKVKEVNASIIEDLRNSQAMAADLADPLRWEKSQLQDQSAALEQWKSTLPVENYTRALETLRLKDMQLRAQEGDTWAIIGTIVTQNSGHATDALVGWMDNLNGLGRTWHTLGDTVRNVIADMLRQMERAIIQQQIMNKAMNWATDPNTWSGLFGGSSGNTGSPSFWTGSGNYGDTGFDANYGKANPSGSSSKTTSIMVQVNTDGQSKATTKEGGQEGVALARMIEGVCDQWAAKNLRPGGMLARH